MSLRKAATFAETGWLAAWAVALVLPVLHTRGWQRAVVGVTVLVFGYVETAVTAVQAWRGVPSHYNFSTPFDAALMRGGAADTRRRRRAARGRAAVRRPGVVGLTLWRHLKGA